jgi:hypothetical protein
MSTLVRGHRPHYTWLFFLFGDSNRPTLFICYPGSIEKLTLLGVIYYYYYYYYYYTDNGASDGDTMQFSTLLPQTIPFLIYNIYFLIRL